MRHSSHLSILTIHLKWIINSFIILFFIEGCTQIGHQKTDLSNKHIEYSYYPTGQKEYTAEYVNGKLDGISSHWSENGILTSESEYSNGKPHGIWKKFHANNTIMNEAHYFHGQKHGIEKWFYNNGQIKSEQSFYYGVPQDDRIRWYPDGSIIY